MYRSQGIGMPRCNRCNYDLSAVAPAKPAVNARGRCSECGLEFDWEDMLHPVRLDIRGFFEHAPKGNVLMSACRTLTWCLWPPVFWSRVRIESRVIPRRWWWLLGALLIIKLPLLYSGARGGMMSMTIHQIHPVHSWIVPMYVVETATHGAVEFNLTWGYTSCNSAESFVPRLDGVSWQGSDHSASVALLVGVPPLMLLCMTSVRRRARLRAVHVWRAAVYGASFWLLLILVHDTVNRLREYRQSRFVARGLSAGQSRLDTALETIAQLWTAGCSGPWFVPICLYYAWGAVWWWCAIRSFRLRAERQVLLAFGLVWGGIGVVLVGPGLVRWLLIHHLWEFI